MASDIHCRHWSSRFAGSRRVDTCAFDIDIRRLVGGKDFGWHTRMPCIHGHFHRPGEAVSCDKREPWTADEIAAHEAKMDTAVAEFMAGRSPCCGAPLLENGTLRHCAKCGEFVARVCEMPDEI